MKPNLWQAACVWSCLASLGVLSACSKTETAPPNAERPTASAEARLQGSAAAEARANLTARLPQIGGTIAQVGDFGVEVALHRNGRVEAVVLDLNGKTVQSAAGLVVSAKALTGSSQRVALAFVAPEARFVGQAAAGAEFGAGPVEIELTHGGQTLRGNLALLAALPEATLGGHLVSAGKYSAEVVLDAEGELRARVLDAAGALLKGGADVSVEATTSLGKAQRLGLAFDAAAQCYTGRLQGEARFAPGPLVLRINAQGAESLGALLEAGISARAAHGGAVLALGSYGVELVARGPSLQAFVFDAKGQASIDPTLKLQAAALGKATANLDLTWDASCNCYVSARVPTLDLNGIPLRLSLTAAGRGFSAAVSSLEGNVRARALAKIGVAADAKAALDADVRAPSVNAKADLRAPNLDAKAKLDGAASSAAKAAAGVKITAPKINISPPKLNVNVEKSVGTKGKATTGAKASGGFSIGTP